MFKKRWLFESIDVCVQGDTIVGIGSEDEMGKKLRFAGLANSRQDCFE